MKSIKEKSDNYGIKKMLRQSGKMFGDQGNLFLFI